VLGVGEEDVRVVDPDRDRVVHAQREPRGRDDAGDRQEPAQDRSRQEAAAQAVTAEEAGEVPDAAAMPPRAAARLLQRVAFDAGICAGGPMGYSRPGKPRSLLRSACLRARRRPGASRARHRYTGYMETSLADVTDLLARTPRLLDAWLRGLPDAWARQD